MVNLTETTVAIAATTFIVILIILAKLSKQMDELTTIMKQIIRKLVQQDETNKWTETLLKEKFEKVINKIEEQTKLNGNK
ncbi:MAG: hypothetical protein A2252_07015 [Elusimicrobia bacterium RIFOXYA2_FULL_39_19]|nr:MAG: hypothetical protein A2252_07015 [Elusimicrobia bacterium RIFOXYA2_FULL_39_19]